jgi:hypothetical protein
MADRAREAALRITSMIAAATALAALAASPCAAAGPEAFVDAGAKVAGHPELTYLDLVKQGVPDLAPSADGKTIEGSLPDTLRNLFGKESDDDPPDPATLTDLETLPFKSGGKPRLALLADFGHNDERVEDFSLLMVFDDSGPTPRLLDAGFVGIDKDTAFSEHPLIAVGRGDDAIVTYSEHFNSDQTYGGWMVSFLHGRRLRMVTAEHLLSDRLCGYERDESPAFTTRAVPGGRFRELDVTVTDEVTHNDEDCGDDKIPRLSKHIYRDSWRWDARRGRFVQRLNGVDRLDKKNEARF